MQHLDGVTGVRSVALQIRRNKCGLYGGLHTRCAELTAELRIPHRPESLTVVGVPIGPAAYQKATVTNRATTVIGLIDTMRNLRRLPLQSQWSLLRLSLNARMCHFLRDLP
jgi:hypothetical protein